MKLAVSVQAVFAHAAVARSSEEGRLLTLLHPSRGLVPFGVVVDWGEARLSTNDTLILAARTLCLGEDRLVELEGEGLDLMVRPSPVSWASLRTQLEALRLRPRTRELLGAGSDDLIVRTAAKRLDALIDALTVGAGARESGAGASERRAPREGRMKLPLGHLDVSSAELEPGPSYPAELELRPPGALLLPPLIAALVGLGPGSTPTGDDLLTGLAACLLRLGPAFVLPKTSSEAFLAALKTLPHGRTTATAAEMLRHAADGAFPEVLVEFVTRLGNEQTKPEALQRAADALAELGAQTGTDMLAGVLKLARRASSNHGGLS